MNEVKEQVITNETLKKGFKYRNYRKLIDKLLETGKTSGENHSEAMIHYTKMNVHRMNRHDKRSELTTDLFEKLSNVDRRMIWVVITEAWCGDAAQTVPIINKMAEASDNIDLHLIFRDENLDVMDQFLYNGKSRSIPKLICLDADTMDILGDWGPRPEPAQRLYETLRTDPDMPTQKVAEILHKWYADDNGHEIQKEFFQLLDEWDV